ncbi:hypothetical protein Syun_027827 [Stephania yunnanensis]|uniref:Uncharacterized protein n=1 Tax=Stephania yunnanensis TaxID=152371 RepID=A0AAP0EG89_9MAGN
MLRLGGAAGADAIRVARLQSSRPVSWSATAVEAADGGSSEPGDRHAEARGQQLQRDRSPARQTVSAEDDAKARTASSSSGPGGGAVVGEDDEKSKEEIRRFQKRVLEFWEAEYVRKKRVDRVSRQDIDGELTRAQRRAEVAMTSTNPSAPADHGKRRPQIDSYWNDKQHATHTLSVRGCPFLGDAVEAEASNVPVGSRSSSEAETTISQMQASGGSS